MCGVSDGGRTCGGGRAVLFDMLHVWPAVLVAGIGAAHGAVVALSRTCGVRAVRVVCAVLRSLLGR